MRHCLLVLVAPLLMAVPVAAQFFPFPGPQGAATAATPQFWSMGFWEIADGSPNTASIPWAALTHFVVWSPQPGANNQPYGGVTPTLTSGTTGTYSGLTYICPSSGTTCNEATFASQMSSISSAAHSHGVKVLLDLPPAAASVWVNAITSNVSQFTTDVANVVKDSNFDGMGIDWEDTGGITQTQFNTCIQSFFQGMRANLPSPTYQLFADGFQTSNFITAYTYGSPSALSVLDRYNMETYDWVGTWEALSWFNSALHANPSCNGGCNTWDWAKGVFSGNGWDLTKLNFGIPFYGYVTTGVAGPNIATSSYTVGAQLTYSQVLSNYSGNISGATYDANAHEPWFAISGPGYVTYENPQAVTDKVAYAKSNGLGGWYMFSLNKDDGSYDLAGAIAAAR